MVLTNDQVGITQKVLQLGSYCAIGFIESFASYGDLDLNSLRWDDELQVRNGSAGRPKFHLVIPARKPTANLCKTLLSAANLNYPPPSALGYGSVAEEKRPGSDVVGNIYNFLLGKEAHDDDLILLVDEGMHSQV